MTLISFLGITLSVFALLATLSVRAGFRSEFTSTILGANAHITFYPQTYTRNGQSIVPTITDYALRIEKLKKHPDITYAAPLIRQQVLASNHGKNIGVDVFAIHKENFKNLPAIKETISFEGFENYDSGIAVGIGIALDLGLKVGDRLKLISPDGVKTTFGTSPRVKSFDIIHIFSLKRHDIDNTRIYMPFQEAQNFFKKDGATALEIMVSKPHKIEQNIDEIHAIAGMDLISWNWKQAVGSFLKALEIEDNVMFIILSILVLIASMNIISGLIMLTKNKQTNIAILRTIGLTRGNILRIFFLCGALIGTAGTMSGVILGCLFTYYIDPIFTFVNMLNGGELWNPAIRTIYRLPAELHWQDITLTSGLSLGLCFIATFLPARRAARLSPTEALRDG